MTSNFIRSTLFAFFVGFRDSLLGTATLLSIDKEKGIDDAKKTFVGKYGEPERPPGRRGPRPRQGKEYVYYSGSHSY